jgi:hypothetical protein
MRGTDPRDIRITLRSTKGSIEDERLFSTIGIQQSQTWRWLTAGRG